MTVANIQVLGRQPLSVFSRRTEHAKSVQGEPQDSTVLAGLGLQIAKAGAQIVAFGLHLFFQSDTVYINRLWTNSEFLAHLLLDIPLTKSSMT